MKTIRILFPLLILFVACTAPAGHEFDMTQVASVQGKTKSEVLSRFGEPTKKTAISGLDAKFGVEHWEYDQASELLRGSRDWQHFTVTFDADGKVCATATAKIESVPSKEQDRPAGSARRRD